jgi:4'-phosphopantetheinyl transferase
MPLHLIRQVTDQAYLGLWHILESPEQLSSDLKKIAPSVPVASFKHPKRKQEWLASRLLAYSLLKKFTAGYHELVHDAYGRPGFTDSPYHISISHCGEWAAVLLSSVSAVGIDLEQVSSRIVALAPRFLSEEELKATNRDPEQICIYWSCKESLYKLYGRKQLIFKQHLRISTPGNMEKELLEGEVVLPGAAAKYTLHVQKINDYVLTYCLSGTKQAGS